MTDEEIKWLVKRLRNRTHQEVYTLGCGLSLRDVPDEDCAEAAQMIADLQARAERVETALQEEKAALKRQMDIGYDVAISEFNAEEARKQRNKAEAQVCALTQSLTDLQAENIASMQTIAELRAENERLREKVAEIVRDAIYDFSSKQNLRFSDRVI